MRRTIALMLCATMGLAGCATSGRLASTPGEAAGPAFDPALMAEYVRRLPVGSRVRIDLADGRVLHARLMKADAGGIVIQRRTRVPEPPQPIAIGDLRAVEIEQDAHTGRTVGIAIGAAAGSVLGVLLLLAAIWD